MASAPPGGAPTDPASRPSFLTGTATTATTTATVPSPPAAASESGSGPGVDPLGVAADAVRLSGSGVDASFGAARAATDFGFGIAALAIGGTSALLARAAGPANPVSKALDHVADIVDIAHDVTTASQSLGLAVTQATLEAAQQTLALAGAQGGELLRLAFGAEVAAALLRINGMARGFTQPLEGYPVTALAGAAQRWSSLQRAALARLQEEADEDEAIENVRLPAGSEKALRYAASTMGSKWKAGLINGASFRASTEAARRVREAHEHHLGAGDEALAAAGLSTDAEVVLYEHGNRSVYAPAHLVAVDYADRAVYVAIRGTASISDVLVDLMCEAEPYEMEMQGLSGHAHEGMLRAARELSPTLSTAVERGLEKLRRGDHSRELELPGGSRVHVRAFEPAEGEEQRPPPKVVLCGHSLGAGVASLLAAEWRQGRGFRPPGEVHMTCFAFACPQVLSAQLAESMRDCCYSLIVGDDAVPRLSLATASDLREVLAILADNDIACADDYEALKSVAQAGLGKDVHRLCPPGRLFYCGGTAEAQQLGALVVGTTDMDELVVSSDMLAVHMPHRYLEAVRNVGESDGGPLYIDMRNLIVSGDVDG
mmetsp:Transcript_763/g.1936  ORF Transcript_763/g.1936 Transcript_763/m.1936 type:complete len:601 (-) Transcript_763:1597-3399(-)